MSSNIITTGPDPLGTVYPVSVNAITLPIFSIIFIFLLIVPFRLLYRVSNIAACSLVIINIISLLFIAINAITWPTDNLSNRWSGHIVCDTQVLVRQSLYTAMASTTCCITMFLARAVDTDNACMHETTATKRRRVVKDCLFCFMIPMLQMALHYVVQSNRYTVMTIYGCVDAPDVSWPSIVILHIWPPIFACLNFYFAVLVIYRLRRHHTNFISTLSSSSSGLSPRRFLKLFSMSVVLLVIYFPIVIYYFYLNVSWPLSPYSWSRIHDPLFWPLVVFWRIADAPPGTQYDAWNWVALALMIFTFWGCNSEGVEVYRRGLVKLGLARWLPRLRMTLQERRVEKMERDGRPGMSTGTTIGSWTGKFDLISKTIHYFDNKEAESRKQSMAMTTALNDGDVTRSSTRKHYHTVQLGANVSNHSGCDSRNTTICSCSVHKPSIATANTNENDISFSSSAPTCNDLDGISPLPRTPPPKNIYSHILETKTKGPDVHGLPVPPPTSRGMWTLFRTHMNPLPLSSFFASNSISSSSSSSDNQHTYSRSQSEVRNRVLSEEGVSDPLFCNAENTLTTQVWSVDNGHRSLGTGALDPGVGGGEDGVYGQDHVLESLKPGTRAYRERERREMVSEREERKRKISGGLSVEKTFEVVEESGGVVHAGSS